jgi:hypothetical protein
MIPASGLALFLETLDRVARKVPVAPRPSKKYA